MSIRLLLYNLAASNLHWPKRRLEAYGWTTKSPIGVGEVENRPICTQDVGEEAGRIVCVCVGV